MLFLTHAYVDGMYRVVGDTTNEVLRLTRSQIEEMRTPILGVFRRPDLTISEIHPVHEGENYGSVLNSVIDRITTPALKQFASYCKYIIPEYFFEVPASVSGRYHPACNIGRGGLVRHTLFVCELFSHIVSIDSTKQLLNLSTEEIDCMLIACMMHDSLKDGWNCKVEDDKVVYDESEGEDVYTLHPINAANLIRGMLGFVDNKYLELISHCIESHMGGNISWHLDSRLTPPSTKYQWLVHMCDYLASRKNITYECGNTVYVRPGTKIKYVNNYKPAAEPISDTTGGSLAEPKPKEALKDNEARAITECLGVGLIPKRFLEECEIPIDTTLEKIKSIWNSVLQYKTVSVKQSKYVKLAVVLRNNLNTLNM